MRGGRRPRQTRAFATEVAKCVGATHAGLGKEGTLFTSGGHLIVGIPPVFEGLEFGP